MRWRFGLSLAHVRVLANVRPALASVAERRVWAVAGGRQGPFVQQACRLRRHWLCGAVARPLQIRTLRSSNKQLRARLARLGQRYDLDKENSADGSVRHSLARVLWVLYRLQCEGTLGTLSAPRALRYDRASTGIR